MKKNVNLATRLSALVADSIFQFITFFMVLPLFLNLVAPDSSMRPNLMVMGLLFGIILYEPILVAFTGQTIGHRIFKVKVEKKDGESLSLPRAIARCYLKYFFGWLSFITVFGQEKQALHDHLTYSRVIKV